MRSFVVETTCRNLAHWRLGYALVVSDGLEQLNHPKALIEIEHADMAAAHIDAQLASHPPIYVATALSDRFHGRVVCGMARKLERRLPPWIHRSVRRALGSPQLELGKPAKGDFPIGGCRPMPGGVAAHVRITGCTQPIPAVMQVREILAIGIDAIASDQLGGLVAVRTDWGS